jgi:hypothetical protein
LIYICIPAHNEERTVGVLLWKIRQVMTHFPRDYQVLVADDASTDATAEVVAPYTRVLPLTVFRNEQRRGYAASLELLLREAVRRSDYPRRDIAITLQADFTEEPDEIPTLIRRIEGGADVVTGAIAFKGAEVPRGVRWSHRLLGWLLRRGTLPEGVSDPLSGFRGYRVITLKRAFEAVTGGPLLPVEGWAANVALLRAVAPFARRVDETPVTVRYDHRHRLTRFQPWETVRQLFALRRSRPVAVIRPPAAMEPAEEERGVAEVAEGAAGAPQRGRRNGRRPAGGERPARREAPERRAEAPRERGERRVRSEAGEAVAAVPVEGEGAQPRPPAAELAGERGEERRERRPRRPRRAPRPRGDEAPAEGEATAQAQPAEPTEPRRRQREEGGEGRAPRRQGRPRAQRPAPAAESAEREAAGALPEGEARPQGPAVQGEAPPRRSVGARRGSRRGGRRSPRPSGTPSSGAGTLGEGGPPEPTADER